MVHSLSQRKKSQQQRRKKTYALLLSAVFILSLFTLIGFAVYRTAMFRIRLIHVDGERGFQEKIFTIAKEQIRYTISNTLHARQTMLAQLPFIASVNIANNIFTRELFITYTARTPILRWCNENEGTLCYAIDEGGVIFDRVAASPDVPAIYGTYLSDIAIGKKIPAQFIDPMKQIASTLKQKQIDVTSFTLLAPYILLAKTSLAPELRLSLEMPITPQLDAFALLLDKLGSPQIAKLHYIDLRIPNKVYYQ